MEEENVFSEAPIGKAVRTMIFPTIISQIIMVIYNMADTWYVGLTGNAYAVAAVSLCLPVYSILSAVSNLFGIGGAGAMARALGVHDRKRAGKVVGMTLLGAMAGAVLYAWFMAAAARPLLLLIGGGRSYHCICGKLYILDHCGRRYPDDPLPGMRTSDPGHGQAEGGQLRYDAGSCA